MIIAFGLMLAGAAAPTTHSAHAVIQQNDLRIVLLRHIQSLATDLQGLDNLAEAALERVSQVIVIIDDEHGRDC